MKRKSKLLNCFQQGIKNVTRMRSSCWKSCVKNMFIYMYQQHSYEFERFQQYALIFFHVQYLSELHCSEKYCRGINCNLFIKNSINYIHVCTFNIFKSYDAYSKRGMQMITYLFMYIQTYIGPYYYYFRYGFIEEKKLNSSQQYFCRLIYKDSPSIEFSRWLFSVLAFTLSTKRLKSISLL